MKLSREVKTAILVISGIGLFIFGYTFLKNSDLLNQDRIFYVKYENVTGLEISTPVTINGLIVGKVTDIDFADKNGSLIVRFSVEKDFEFSKNCVVAVGGKNNGRVYSIYVLAKIPDAWH